MIGLGSNRLMVCRRGGMSVTQAGRGGMEWLAGGRRPSWASPYSAQATAALKAQFPTQWPTIRDYGFAHPALVPFINEDPMLVMSLIDGLGIRRFICDGQSYIKTGIISSPQCGFEGDAIYADVSNTQPGYCYVYASGVTQVFGVTFWNSKWGVGYGSSANGPTLSTNVEYQIKNQMGDVKITGTDGTNYTYTFGSTTNIVDEELFFPASHQKGTTPSKNPKLKGKHFKCYNNGALVRDFVLCKNPNGADYGLLDIVNAVWYPNQGSGSFGKEEIFPS